MGKGQQRLVDILDFARRELGKCVRDFTLRRWLNKWGYRWKRMRKSLKHERNEDAFEHAKRHLEALHEQETEQRLDVFYFDEMGVNLTPSVPYGWQIKGQRILLPTKRSENQTVLGFVNKQLENQFFLFKGAANSKVVVECFNQFVDTLTKKTVVVLDNATPHTSKLFQSHQEVWKEKGLYLFFIPPYSPELNLLERLWKEIKYSWLKTQFIIDEIELENQLVDVLKNIGTKFTISFV